MSNPRFDPHTEKTNLAELHPDVARTGVDSIVTGNYEAFATTDGRVVANSHNRKTKARDAVKVYSITNKDNEFKSLFDPVHKLVLQTGLYLNATPGSVLAVVASIGFFLGVALSR